MKVGYTLTLKDVPIDGFWSIGVYNAKGFFEKRMRYRSVNCLPIVAGWNYTVRLYRPRTTLLNGTWKLPEAQPLSAR